MDKDITGSRESSQQAVSTEGFDPARKSSCDTGRAAPVYTEDALTNRMLDFLDARADEWMKETHIVAATHGMCATFDGYVPREILARFRRSLEAQFHLCFVEGGLRAWGEISEQQRALGQPLPAIATEAGTAETAQTGSVEDEGAAIAHNKGDNSRG